jgi:hypothetical protein
MKRLTVGAVWAANRAEVVTLARASGGIRHRCGRICELTLSADVRTSCGVASRTVSSSLFFEHAHPIGDHAIDGCRSHPIVVSLFEALFPLLKNAAQTTHTLGLAAGRG